MFYLTYCNISNITEKQVDFLRERIKTHFSEKAKLKKKDSVCAKAVLCYLLEEKFSLTDYGIDCDDNDKPYLVNSSLGFNLSHSGDYVLCVCGDEKVGCDIQIIKAYNEKIARRFFTEAEYRILSVSEDKASAFTELWTLKESILKYHGDGISGGLSTYDFSKYIDNYCFEAFGLCFRSIEIPGYIISICSESTEIRNYSIDADILIKLTDKKMKGE